MKTPIVPLALFAIANTAIPAHADDATVEITSFNLVSQTRVAELCGKATRTPPAPSHVRINVDPKSKNPGAYHVTTGPDGLFCTVVVTYTGRADAVIE